LWYKLAKTQPNSLAKELSIAEARRLEQITFQASFDENDLEKMIKISKKLIKSNKGMHALTWASMAYETIDNSQSRQNLAKILCNGEYTFYFLGLYYVI
jgi:hypothetical protein